MLWERPKEIAKKDKKTNKQKNPKKTHLYHLRVKYGKYKNRIQRKYSNGLKGEELSSKKGLEVFS